MAGHANIGLMCQILPRPGIVEGLQHAWDWEPELWQVSWGQSENQRADLRPEDFIGIEPAPKIRVELRYEGGWKAYPAKEKTDATQ